MIFINIRQPNLYIHLEPYISILSSVFTDMTVFCDYDHISKIIQQKFEHIRITTSEQITKTQDTGVTISADFHSVAPRNTIHLNVLHNQPVKYWMHPRQLLLNFDGFLCWGPLQKSYIEHLYKNSGLMAPMLFDVGSPYLDFLIQNRERSGEYKKKLLSEPSNPTILYAPSWNPFLSIQENGTQILDFIKHSTPDINVIIRLHPASLFDQSHPQAQYFTGGKNWRSQLKNLTAISKNVYDHSLNHSALESLLITDCVLTDVSSIAWDALLTDSSVFHIECPRWPENAKQNAVFGNPEHNLTVGHDFLNAGVAYGNGYIKTSNIPSLLRAISNGESDLLKSHRGHINRIENRLLFNPGNSREPLISNIKHLLSKF